MVDLVNKYEVMVEDSLRKLEETISHKLNSGYELVGGLVIDSGKFYQAISSINVEYDDDFLFDLDDDEDDFIL